MTTSDENALLKNIAFGFLIIIIIITISYIGHRNRSSPQYIRTEADFQIGLDCMMTSKGNLDFCSRVCELHKEPAKGVCYQGVSTGVLILDPANVEKA